MKAFWRVEPLTATEMALLSAVFVAHDQSARRSNLSADAVIRAAVGSGNYFQSMAAGLMTLGGVHGPIEQTMLFLSAVDPVAIAKEIQLVPGWGSSFHKGVPDPEWAGVDEFLRINYPEWHGRLVSVTETLHAKGKKIYPNPSAYTAVAALIVGMPKECAAYLLVAGRLAVWTELFQRAL